MKKTNHYPIITAIILLCSVLPISAIAKTGVKQLVCEYAKTPLGIDVKTPRFSWQMSTSEEERGFSQAAYQLVVTGSDGKMMWDSKKITDNKSLNIQYAGKPLQPTTRYKWSVTAWDQTGKTAVESSWFETGLLNPDPQLSAWDGATWIGGNNDDLVLYSPYLSIFDLKYKQTIEKGSKRASFIYGANDPRLMNKYLNIFQVENKKNESYIKIELDISPIDGTENGKAKLNIYRAGYKDADSPATPLKTFEVQTEFINNSNKNKEHELSIRSQFGYISISLNGSSSFIVMPAASENQPSIPGVPREVMRRMGGGASVNANSAGMGGDALTFGMLCDIGFSVDAGQKATFSDVVVSNCRYPNSTLFSEDLAGTSSKSIYSVYAADSNSGLSIANGKYSLTGGTNGSFVTANPSRNSVPMLRTEFKTSAKSIAAARLYVTARGIYEVYLNGKRVGDDYYNPGLSQYNITHFYQTYDVTDMVKTGENAVGAMLSEGWWSGLLSFGNIWNHFGDRQSLLAKLVISYADGSKSVITTNNKDWKYYNNGPIIYSSLDFGEAYDASKEAAIEGWTNASYDDGMWKKATAIDLKGTAYQEGEVDFRGAKDEMNWDQLSITGQIGNNAGIYKRLKAQSVKEVRPKVFVYNMGQNFVGVPKITIKDGKAGSKITLRVSEMLYPNLPASAKNVGALMTENYRAALSQDTWIMKDGEQVIQPHFTSHGYQYIEITGIDEPLALENVEGIVISSVRSLTADYTTSNPKVNQLWSNLVWSNVDNFLTIPTDCPQRNERMGWSGDISVFSRTATYVSNAGPFLTRHMYAMRDVQSAKGKFADVSPVGGGFGGVLWGSAGIVVPWETYLQYKDAGLLEQHYQAMVKYMDYLETTIDPKTGLSSDGQLGDWLGTQNNILGTAFLVTAYHAYDLGIMSKVAKVLRKTGDAEKYQVMYEKRREFFNKTFVNADKKTLGFMGGRRMDPAGLPAVPAAFKVADTQTSYAVGLALDLFNAENKPAMIQNLAETVKRQNKDDGGDLRPAYSLMTGFIGTAWISKALSDNGLSELAYKLLQNNQYPSWLYSIEQGATSIWERLNGYTVEHGFGGNNGMNSFNHYSFGAVGQWMMAYSLGIQRDEPGFKKFILQPEIDPTGQMTSAKGHYDSMYGRIESGWRLENGKKIYSVAVPANTTATLYLPVTDPKKITEGGNSTSKVKGVRFINYQKGKVTLEVQSGNYEFVTE
ncbi:MAG: family 78 glycoside hydrolase catalytic domain [Mariniphaga sp.]|nr:family 78 glycoside hydrolase catalytic domain [Mariniphaga sp.]